MNGPAPNSSTTRRCPACNALLNADRDRCIECELLAADRENRTSEPPSRGTQPEIVQLVMQLGIPLDQLAAVAICIVWLVIRCSYLGLIEGLIPGVATLLFPMALIWFADEIGAFTGFRNVHYVSSECNPSFVKLIGWIGLVVTIGYSAYRIFSV